MIDSAHDSASSCAKVRLYETADSGLADGAYAFATAPSGKSPSKPIDTPGLYARIFATLFDACLVTDAKGWIVAANRAAAELLGIPLAGLIGCVLANQIAPSDRPGLNRRIAHLARGHRIRPWSVRLGGDGDDGVEIRGATIAGAERAVGPLRFLWSLRRASDDHSRAATMAATIAHELNQPLHVVRLAAEASLMLMNEGETDPALHKDQLEVIAAQARRMVEIVGHVRMLAGVDQAPTEIFDPVASVRNAVAMAADDFRAAGIALDVEAPARPIALRGHPIRLEQVIINLLRNALDACKAHDIHKKDIGDRVALSLADEGAWLRLAVADSGGGIADSAKKHLFEPFFTTKPADRGTGLGLAVCLGIVTAMGGRITARNQGPGAVFEVVLPKARGGGATGRRGRARDRR